VVDMKNTKGVIGRTRTAYTLGALDFIPGLYCRLQTDVCKIYAEVV
jgi:hypothetical protein